MGESGTFTYYYLTQKEAAFKFSPKYLDTYNSLNPLTPMSDQDIISPYNINALSTR